jgi:DNA adenine methylase
MTNTTTIQAKPFLKWAGGKRQLLNELEANLPTPVKKTKQIDVYIEPFVGGGALLFYLLSNYKVKKSIINDINADLMLTYKVIKLYPEDLIKRLSEIQREYLKLDTEERKEYFYENLRTPYNKLKVNYKNENQVNSTEKAALLIALNKTCFNGLYRQNSKGEFNVPAGRYKKPKILDEENILNVSKLLKNTEIQCGTYKNIKVKNSKKTFIYFDPPYRPLSTSSSFTKYSKGDFNDEDQKKLAEFYSKLDKDDHYLLLSNSDPKCTNPEDNFFEDLYKGFKIQRVLAKRYINSKASGRGEVIELLIRNY